jgi:adenosine deaminase
MKEMAARKIAVEINLTSNAVILGVTGKDHPLVAYRAAGVPVVLSTDDEGVSRSDMTNEYMRAVTEQGLRYRDLKQMARASLDYSFLSAADKAKAKAALEKQFAAFEAALPGP